MSYTTKKRHLDEAPAGFKVDYLLLEEVNQHNKEKSREVLMDVSGILNRSGQNFKSINMNLKALASPVILA